MGNFGIAERLLVLTPAQIALSAFVLLLQGAVFALVPEEVILLTLGILWGTHHISFGLACVAVAAGLLPANLFMAFLGSRLGAGVLKTKLGGWLMPQAQVDMARRFLLRFGSWVVFFARFTPSVRAPIYFAAGAFGTSLGKFAKADFLGALIQVPLILWAGRELGQQAESLARALGVAALSGLGFCITGVVFSMVWNRARRTKKLSGTAI